MILSGYEGTFLTTVGLLEARIHTFPVVNGKGVTWLIAFYPELDPYDSKEPLELCSGIEPDIILDEITFGREQLKAVLGITIDKIDKDKS